jgi:hypothetical protein
MARHFQAVDGNVYCLCSTSGTTSRGVIGIPWTQECDCVNYFSERMKQRRSQAERERQEGEAAIQQLVDVVLAKKSEALSEGK